MYRVIARNPATASENRIHGDDEARRHGFRGGLVPGVTVYAYAVHAIVDALGPAWVERGGAGLRFRSPCYDGDEVAAEVGSDGAVTVSVGQSVCATGWATLSSAGPDAVADDVPPAAEAPPPSERPAASESVLPTGRVLGSIRLADEPGYLDKVGEASTLYAERGWVHPGQVLEGANRVLMANVVLPAWLHVESTMQHRRAVALGEAVDVRARVAELWERKGHRFVTLDVGWVAGDEVVATARHTAIWQLAGAV